MRAAASALLLLMCWSLPRSVMAAEASLVEAARKEGRITWYTTLIVNQIARPMAAAFEAKYPGITVGYSRSTNPDTAAKLLTEARAGGVRGDVVDGTSVLEPLEDADLLRVLPPEFFTPYPAALVDPGHRWVGTNVYFMTAAYNTDLVAEQDVPHRYEDLLNPRWRGKIAWTNDPTPNGPPGFVYNVLNTMGEDGGMTYLRALSAQRIVNVPSSQRAVLDQVVAGEYPIALMTFNHHSVISQREGAPVAWIRMEPLLATSSALGVLKNAPHPNAALLFAEFVLSSDGQKVIADANYLPALPGTATPIPEALPDTGHFRTTTLTPAIAREQMPRMRKLYEELFR